MDSEAAANKYLNQIPGQARENISPYIKPGMEASSFVNEILGSYKPSQGYQFKEDKLKKALGNTAAAGGFAGTQYDQEQQGALINALMGEDMQQYLQNVLGVHNKSFEASQYLNDVLGNTLGSQAGLAFRGAEQNNAERASKKEAMLGLLANALGAAGSIGGTLLGGAPGGAIGGQLANLFKGMGGSNAGRQPGWGSEALFGSGTTGGINNRQSMFGSGGNSQLFGTRPGLPGYGM